jgi:1,4-alpha-glucan branching enzyme
MTKKYLKSRPTAKVTFRVPKAVAGAAGRVSLVGDFNGWNVESTPLTRLKNGDYSIVLELPTGAAYRFKYCIDRERWENDWHADRYVPNEFGGEDSLVVV